MRAKWIIEAANSPITYEAYQILEERGIPMLPDILCNAGGVIVSHFEWMQNVQRQRWSLEHVVTELSQILLKAYHEVVERAAAQQFSFKEAAMDIGISRVVEATHYRML